MSIGIFLVKLVVKSDQIIWMMTCGSYEAAAGDLFFSRVICSCACVMIVACERQPYAMQFRY